MSTSPLHLAFGLNGVAPDTSPAVWGCRAICTQDGEIDIVYDRQDCVGNPDAKKRIVAWLNSGASKAWIAAASQLLEDYRMSTRDSEQFTLFDDPIGTVCGNTNASAGYLYVVAWLKPVNEYQPKTGTKCSCKRGVQRDNCPLCEGTGWTIDFVAIRARNKAQN